MVKKIARYKFVSITSLVSILLVLGGSLWACFSLRIVTNGPLILHFNDINGITAVGGMGLLFFMGAFGLIATVANGFIAIEFEERNAFLGKLVAILTLVFAILLFIGFASILGVN